MKIASQMACRWQSVGSSSRSDSEFHFPRNLVGVLCVTPLRSIVVVQGAATLW